MQHAVRQQHCEHVGVEYLPVIRLGLAACQSLVVGMEIRPWNGNENQKPKTSE